MDVIVWLGPDVLYSNIDIVDEKRRRKLRLLGESQNAIAYKHEDLEWIEKKADRLIVLNAANRISQYKYTFTEVLDRVQNRDKIIWFALYRDMVVITTAREVIYPLEMHTTRIVAATRAIGAKLKTDPNKTLETSRWQGYIFHTWHTIFSKHIDDWININKYCSDRQKLNGNGNGVWAENYGGYIFGNYKTNIYPEIRTGIEAWSFFGDRDYVEDVYGDSELAHRVRKEAETEMSLNFRECLFAEELKKYNIYRIVLNTAKRPLKNSAELKKIGDRVLLKGNGDILLLTKVKNTLDLAFKKELDATRILRDVNENYNGGQMLIRQIG